MTARKTRALMDFGGGVDWFLPGRKRRFATSTVATSDLITLLADEGKGWPGIHDAILFDPEAKAIAYVYVQSGYGETHPVLYASRHRYRTPSATPNP